jgi:hypothetical protein
MVGGPSFSTATVTVGGLLSVGYMVLAVAALRSSLPTSGKVATIVLGVALIVFTAACLESHRAWRAMGSPPGFRALIRQRPSRPSEYALWRWYQVGRVSFLLAALALLAFILLARSGRLGGLWN